jgi:hypothetical protein
MTPSRVLSRLSLVLVSILVLTVACSGSIPTLQPAEQPAATAVAVGQAGQAQEVSPKPSAADATQPSVTSQPAIQTQAPDAASGLTRIQFPSGGTSATLQGSLPAGGVQRYVLRAMAGQTLTVQLSPASIPAYLVIWGADGSVLLSGAWEGKEWSGVLTISEDYYIDVKSTGGAIAQYSLWVEIPPAVQPEPQASRIRFPAGGTSATVQDTVPAGGAKRYVLGAVGGQTMTVELMYPSGEALLVIWGADGSVLISDHADAQQWSGTLPGTQDYYIDVRAAAGGSAVAYTLQVSIPPAAQPEPQASRIQFPAGGTSATLQGSLPAGGVKRYVLGAMAGQTMTVQLSPASIPAYLVIWGADGSVLLSGAWEGKEWGGVLTITEDYYIDVKSTGGATTQYSLWVEIPPR